MSNTTLECITVSSTFSISKDDDLPSLLCFIGSLPVLGFRLSMCDSDDRGRFHFGVEFGAATLSKLTDWTRSAIANRADGMLVPNTFHVDRR